MIINAFGDDGAVLLREAVRTFSGVEARGDEFLQTTGAVAQLAVEEGQVVGWCWGYFMPRPDGVAMAYVHEIEVLESRRRKDVGGQLMKAFADVVASRGASKMFLTTGASNEAARHLYDALGGGLAAQGPTVNYWFALPLS